MNSLAQEEKPIKYETKNFSLPDKMPLYPGGDGALRAFLSLNLHYPEKAQAFGVEGRSLMKFCVSSDGSIKDISAVDCKITNYNRTEFNKLPLSNRLITGAYVRVGESTSSPALTGLPSTESVSLYLPL